MFNLTIDLTHEHMNSGADVAYILPEIQDDLERGKTHNIIRGHDGDYLGHWSIQK